MTSHLTIKLNFEHMLRKKHQKELKKINFLFYLFISCFNFKGPPSETPNAAFFTIVGLMAARAQVYKGRPSRLSAGTLGFCA